MPSSEVLRLVAEIEEFGESISTETLRDRVAGLCRAVRRAEASQATPFVEHPLNRALHERDRVEYLGKPHGEKEPRRVIAHSRYGKCEVWKEIGTEPNPNAIYIAPVGAKARDYLEGGSGKYYGWPHPMWAVRPDNPEPIDQKTLAVLRDAPAADPSMGTTLSPDGARAALWIARAVFWLIVLGGLAFAVFATWAALHGRGVK